MKTKEVVVEARDTGERTKANLLLCPTCDAEAFLVYHTARGHLHFQCYFCDETFCDGTCTSITPVPTEQGEQPS